jgi:rRNA processing protein Krr1/Pno1
MKDANRLRIIMEANTLRILKDATTLRIIIKANTFRIITQAKTHKIMKDARKLRIMKGASTVAYTYSYRNLVTTLNFPCSVRLSISAHWKMTEGEESERKQMCHSAQ